MHAQHFREFWGSEFWFCSLHSKNFMELISPAPDSLLLRKYALGPSLSLP